MWYSWFWPEGSINAQHSTFFSFHFVPRDLNLRRHKRPGLAVQGTWTRAPRRESKSLGTNWKPKNVEFRAFLDPSGQNQLTTLHYHPKYEIWTIEKKLVNNPFNLMLSQTSQELRMLSSVTINCQVTKIVMKPGSQLSVL